MTASPCHCIEWKVPLSQFPQISIRSRSHRNLRAKPWYCFDRAVLKDVEHAFGFQTSDELIGIYFNYWKGLAPICDEASYSLHNLAFRRWSTSPSGLLVVNRIGCSDQSSSVPLLRSAVAVAEGGLRVEAGGSWIDVPYLAINDVSVASEKPKIDGICLRCGATDVKVPILGGGERFRDGLGFSAFLRSVVSDIARSKAASL